jgi:predicted RNA-binding Zn-ribbon protein involved in translation (DUF1610 family)
MIWDKETFIKEIEDSYPKAYPIGMKVAILEAIESKKIRDLGNLWADLIKYESTSKWWHSPPDWNTIKKYVKEWGTPQRNKEGTSEVDNCTKCNTQIKFRYGHSESYTCTNCGYNAIESFHEFKANKGIGKNPKEGSAGEKLKDFKIGRTS